MSENDIKFEIRFYVSKNHDSWTIGVTDRPDERKQEHEKKGEDVSCWDEWNASTEAVARRIEKHFLAKGCNGASGGGGSANWVYIF